jgi:hypothetical protein
MNLFTTAFRILQSEGEDAARTWYAALSPQEKEQFSSEIKTVTESTIADLLAEADALLEQVEATQ